MPESPADNWPAYKLGASGSHLHAVGVLVVAWNNVESAYAALIQAGMPENIVAAVRIFELLGNESRWQFIAEESTRRLAQDEAEEVRYFLKSAAICKENRNAIAHSNYSPTMDKELAMITKGRAKDGDHLRQYWFDVSSIRAMADETFLTSAFGFSVFRTIISRRAWPTMPPHMQQYLPLTLPDRPPLPRKWDRRSQPNPSDAPPPPESSQA